MGKQRILYSQLDDQFNTSIEKMSPEQLADMTTWQETIPTARLMELRDIYYARANHIPKPDGKYGPTERAEAAEIAKFYVYLLEKRNNA